MLGVEKPTGDAPDPVTEFPPSDMRTTADLAAGFAWGNTALGPRQLWDPSLEATVQLILGCPIAMALTYGDDYVLVYNDAYAQLLGRKHPNAFGCPAPEVFPDLWRNPGVGDVLAEVYRTGRPFRESETVIHVARNAPNGSTEPAFFTRGHSAVRDRNGAVIGVLTVAAETSEAMRRLQGLSEFSTALAGALTIDDVARATMSHILSAFGGHHTGFAVDEAGAWRAARRVDGDLLDEADERLPPLWRRFSGTASVPLADAANLGRSLFLSDHELEPYRAHATDQHDRSLRSLAAIPLRAGALRGAITLGFYEPHPWLPAERALLSAVGELVGQAAQRARLFETQHGTSQLLQRSLLPQTLPNVDRFRVAARYEPGVDGNAAGGDFYDAFELGDDRLAIVLGDVIGHDVRAAALMGQVRAALRALALTDPAPETVLAGLDRVVRSLATGPFGDETFVTVLYGIVDARSDILQMASAGHLPPLLRRTSPTGPPAEVTFIDVPPGAPLGLDGDRHTVDVKLSAGDTVLLISDGVVERRGQTIDVGLAALARAVAEAGSGDPRNLCALLSRAVPGSTDDDVAVLALEYASAPSRSASLQLPAEPTAPARLRRWLASQLRSWQVSEEVSDAAVLCASELATNALLHAGTPARVDIDLSPERLLVAVSDHGTRGSVTLTQTEALSSRGRGLGMVEALADAWGTDPTHRGSTVWFELLL
jgi:GAF domain-containing protein/anti-sigma regulatory factor (Ser/Thr protein kinase)